jgi:BlaI family transcriptional regulator, penicillinase repressor
MLGKQQGTPPTLLSRRERQVMDIVYRSGEVTVAEVLAELPDPPTYSAVRALLRILESKGHLSHRQDGPRYVYTPKVPREAARESALARVLGTFFDGSVEHTVATLLDLEAENLSDEELDRLAELVAAAKRKGN